MMIKKIAMLLAVAGLIQSAAYAAVVNNIEEINVDEENNITNIRISGNIPDLPVGHPMGREVTLEILYPENSASDIEENRDAVYYINQTTADTNGNYSFDVKMKATGGQYLLRIGYMNSNFEKYY